MKNDKTKKHLSFADICWNGWCCLSLIGIWPRFIEHRLVSTTRLRLKIKNLPPGLQGLKIVQFSDLHLHAGVSDAFLEKIQKKIKACHPDIILFTGDFLCFSVFTEVDRLKKFFDTLSAPAGCYAILGNHDYDKFISINEAGEYDILDKSVGSLGSIFKRLWTETKLAFRTTDRARAVKPNAPLEELIKTTPVKLLKNETIQVPIKGSFLNLTGLEEYITGRCNPEEAFKNYDPAFPGVVMLHNPDGVPLLLSSPGEVILCGHTHGGQVNLPWLWKKFTLMENPQFKRGLFRLEDKWMYVNRGLGSVIPFRWFAMPEILELTLEAHDS
jgi:uncharacterized protein